ncbi:MAG: UbiA family prenyltransferase, partial [Rhodospirillaceae bacterium]|nr:UbiA family prenyltransferase [Rhodospirillaceae bacterium]
MSLVVFTGACGLILAPGSISIETAIIAVICIAAGAGASGAINMWYDEDIDRIMRRTQNRPIPAGRMNPKEALYIGGF